MLSTPAVHLDVDSVDDVEKVFHNRHHFESVAQRGQHIRIRLYRIQMKGNIKDFIVLNG